MKKRSSGVLLHVTSLPSIYGIGDLGSVAYKFVDFLVATKQRFWQILPLNPTEPGLSNSPYSSSAAFAGNPLLVSFDILIKEGLLKKSDIPRFKEFSKDKVEYRRVSDFKYSVLYKVCQKHSEEIRLSKDFKSFCKNNKYWLNDYALFMVSKKHFNNAEWDKWPKKIRDRDQKELKKLNIELCDEILIENIYQYLFFKQWIALKKYCNDRKIKIIGDIPIYVTFNSVDVWAHSKVFQLDKNKKPLFVSGVPPDYFSKTGQLWGNPVYDWKALKRQGYGWWKERLKKSFEEYDQVRLDHFRGYQDYWQVPRRAKTAMYGKWAKGPSKDFFEHMVKYFGDFPVIAEDLGVITQDVRDLMDYFGFPGMRLLIFAFKGIYKKNRNALHNHLKNNIIYTGTHDNNTVRGWFEKESKKTSRAQLFRIVGKTVTKENVNWAFIEMGMKSISNVAIFPLQDILGFGVEARMNKPSTIKGNWSWRFSFDQLKSTTVKKFQNLTRQYNRG
ncbi:MAG: 4-alpha-glucanotransferase [Candidatus Zapsychrus exili]|nr:4-alpha-glucanotransferase [Candidatus Zapsychrus exili]